MHLVASVCPSVGLFALSRLNRFSRLNRLTYQFKATTGGVPEAHLGHACKPCFIAAIPFQTLLEEMSLSYPPLDTWRTIITHSHMFVMGLLP